MCDERAAEADEARPRPTAMDPGLAREGLPCPGNCQVGDPLGPAVHGSACGHVLSGQRRPWLLIDPKPYVGDPHYDVLQHLLNCRIASR